MHLSFSKKSKEDTKYRKVLIPQNIYLKFYTVFLNQNFFLKDCSSIKWKHVENIYKNAYFNFLMNLYFKKKIKVTINEIKGLNSNWHLHKISQKTKTNFLFMLRGLSTFAPEFRAYFWRWIAKKLHMMLTQSFFYLISTLLKFKKKFFFFSLSWPWRVLESISVGAT